MDDAVELLILRHAQAGHAFSEDDHGRTLTDRGAEQARAVGQRLLAEQVLPDATICSDAMRTRQTCIWINHELEEKAPTPYLDGRLYGAGSRHMLSVINETPETVRRLLVIGHLPTVQDLGMELASVHSAEDPVLRLASRFPTAGLARFVVEKPWAELDGRDARLIDFWD
ncbi:SixA phosphatase family protein [Nesterenkonia sp. PF2B19]|uniref:SixA phosphatase family protein n=1 Tax=unclassified Nesterenkonia TaxID=2629769 RepID=UPI000871FC10|nr:histidine phosphatase family protein [Nesterenkonia sp. PF2B19]OSM42028.1 histidine phosphatase [Nesterenkonia sp. PF2B19]